MIHRCRVQMLMGISFLFALVAAAQTRHLQLNKEIIQQRLDLYKGSDSTREAALFKLFAVAGCTPANLSEQPVPHQKQPNIICVLPGATPETIVVGAHFDHVSPGAGIVDNWSGASLLPSLYQSLADEPRTHTFVFVAFTAEEDGLRGSDFYTSQLAGNQLAQIRAMVNLDTLGLGPTEVWVNQSDPFLVNRLVAVAHLMGLPVTGMNLNGFGESDEEPFIRRKVCSLIIHSITHQTSQILHTFNDNASAIRFQDYYDTYSLVATYLSVLDNAAVGPGHRCNAKPL